MLRRLAKRLQESLDQIPATEKTALFGDPKEEVIVELDPAIANGHGLTPSEISQYISGFDAKLPAGRVQGSAGDLTLEVSGNLETLTRLSRTPIRKDRQGATVELGDIATVHRGTPNPPAAQSVIGGYPAIVVGAQVRDAARIDHWYVYAKETLSRFETDLPNGV